MVTILEEKALLSLPTVVLAAISIICCVYVNIAILKAGYRPFFLCCKTSCNLRVNCCGACICKCYCCRFSDDSDDNSHAIAAASRSTLHPHQPSGLIDIIFWMCITDINYCIFFILNWLPLAMDTVLGTQVPFWSGLSCTILGVYAQIFSVQTALWHLLLAYNLAYLLMDGSLHSLQKLQKQRCAQYLVVIILSIGLAILPSIFGKYGIYRNNNSFDEECWIRSEPWQLITVCSLLLSLIVHWCIVIMLCCKYRKYANYTQSARNLLNGQCQQKSVYLAQYKSVINRLFRFVFVYTIIRIVPTMERIWELFTEGPPPLPLIVGHHACVAMIGIANFIAWKINQMDPNTNWSSQRDDRLTDLLDDMKQQQKQHNQVRPGTMSVNATTCTVDSSLVHDSATIPAQTTSSLLGSRFIWNVATNKSSKS